MTWLNWPNRITIGRILLVGPLVICLLQLNDERGGWRHIALGLLIIMALSDALDGYLARKLNQETPIGRFLDPVADKLLIACAVVILALGETAVPGYRLPNWVPVIAIGKDVITTLGFGLVYATTGVYFIEPRILGKACTLVQLSMLAGCLIAPDLPESFHGIWLGTYFLASGLAVVAVIDYLRVGNRFAVKWHTKKQKDTT